MRRKIRIKAVLPLVLMLLVAATAYGASCSGDDDDSGAGNPESAATAADYERALDHASPKLAALYANGDAILDGGLAAYEEQIAELDGFPVVVNKWASWCGPCRFEFPFFQRQALERGDEVAFLGVNTTDDPDAARTFLEQLPLPYPSFADPESEIARAFDAVREFPATAFYDSSGELVHVRRGPYASEDELAAEIDRYAR